MLATLLLMGYICCSMCVFHASQQRLIARGSNGTSVGNLEEDHRNFIRIILWQNPFFFCVLLSSKWSLYKRRAEKWLPHQILRTGLFKAAAE